MLKNNKKTIDVLIVGDIAGADVLLAEQIARTGLRVCVLRQQKKKQIEKITDVENFFEAFALKNIVYISNAFSFLKYAYESRLIVSLTGSLLLFLTYPLFLIKKLLFLPPIMNFATGADMCEWVNEKSLSARFYRNYLRFVKINWVVPFPCAVKAIFRHKVPNVHFIRHPSYIINNKGEDNYNREEDMILFFHPSHIDWQASDNKNGRYSSKGNDRFLRAYFRAIKTGLNAKCVMLERGPDRELAREMIKREKIEEHFVWKPHLTREQLFEEYKKVDVLVDQFDYGGAGLISFEAMALGKPCIVYSNENCFRLLYGDDLPPVLNCWSEDEIFQQIMKCKNREFIRKQGQKSKQWVLRNHNSNVCMDHFLFYYSLLTGNVIKDYGWMKDAYKHKR